MDPTHVYQVKFDGQFDQPQTARLVGAKIASTTEKLVRLAAAGPGSRFNPSSVHGGKIVLLKSNSEVVFTLRDALKVAWANEERGLGAARRVVERHEERMRLLKALWAEHDPLGPEGE